MTHGQTDPEGDLGDVHAGDVRLLPRAGWLLLHNRGQLQGRIL